MSSEHKGAWAYLVTALGPFAVDAVVLLRRADGGPVHDVAHVTPMLWTVGVSAFLTVLVRVALEVARPSDSHLAEVRDKEISRFGDWVGSFVLAIGAAGVLALAMIEVEHFWIANALDLVSVLQAVVASVVKLGAYRSGI